MFPKLYPIVSLFAPGAMVGMHFIALVIRGKKRPIVAAIIRGIFVTAALILLIN